ncbi:GTPase inhibitor [Cryptococcus deuterogattii 99/473]|uniref:GTPase inhibitor n=1 Tax=Cryptococcus deuterogattii Ram5 TaxID=1296110 RepID=A0A0D0T3W1_9TREE|nr:GTPase inhibitor [Cryptococcus deuterogattii LA55]KIR35122.1 GTPase inhibitor [Cryptococcus deuterogattii MMRL2647]KIR40467.1 GTPase inhibitor [Cryptococcus deuterogattii Ram5]KIR72179.1 GTPase inhibitor [Cryptococcus deuterogattii CA1014]KIR93740.1 GTPase inhibitor [Cryptococcus deuterogattii CBS 10090]KIY58708.1 GTPase inhibitor [Cryptococcus deuterogattii 99/473]
MVNPDEDTEFNDALRRHGILPPKPPSRSPSPDIPRISHTDAVRAVAATADADQLVTLIEGDNLDSDDERMFEEYKRKRLHEMKKEEKKGRYGSMEPLAREDFVREVTEGSKVDPNGEQTEDQVDSSHSVPLSQHLRPLLNQAAAAHPSTKFLSIPAGLCIPNYPDKNVPTLLIYRNGEMVGNVVAGMGLKGMKTTVRDLEGLLLYFKAVEKPSAALLRSNGANERSDSEDDFNDDVGTVNTRGGSIRTGGVGIGAGRGKEDSDDSDFDM